jgi:hypothetical protein
MAIINELTSKLHKLFLSIEYSGMTENSNNMVQFNKDVEEYAINNSDNLSDNFILYCLL